MADCSLAAKAWFPSDHPVSLLPFCRSLQILIVAKDFIGGPNECTKATGVGSFQEPVRLTFGCDSSCSGTPGMWEQGLRTLLVFLGTASTALLVLLYYCLLFSWLPFLPFFLRPAHLVAPLFFLPVALSLVRLAYDDGLPSGDAAVLDSYASFLLPSPSSLAPLLSVRGAATLPSVCRCLTAFPWHKNSLAPKCKQRAIFCRSATDYSYRQGYCFAGGLPQYNGAPWIQTCFRDYAHLRPPLWLSAIQNCRQTQQGFPQSNFMGLAHTNHRWQATKNGRSICVDQHPKIRKKQRRR